MGIHNISSKVILNINAKIYKNRTILILQFFKNLFFFFLLFIIVPKLVSSISCGISGKGTVKNK